MPAVCFSSVSYTHLDVYKRQYLGFGERSGNANLSAIIPNLQLKRGYLCIPENNMSLLTRTARSMAEVANIRPVSYTHLVMAAEGSSTAAKSAWEWRTGKRPPHPTASGRPGSRTKRPPPRRPSRLWTRRKRPGKGGESRRPPIPSSR